MIYGVILIYYEKYYIRAISEFERLLSKMGANYKLIVVTNNLNINPLKRNDICWIEGDNTNWDFSGWQKGLAEVSSVHDKDVFIFANDTFCYHNHWGRYELASASIVFKLCNAISKFNNKSIICGHRLFLSEKYTLLGNTTDKWVSTYLFFMNGRAINSLDKKICLSEGQLNRLVSHDENGEIEWGDVSFTLQKHITEWIFPDTPDVGWYNQSNTDIDIKIRKIKTILNEKYLTAVCEKNKGYIFDFDILRTLKYFFRR